MPSYPLDTLRSIWGLPPNVEESTFAVSQYLFDSRQVKAEGTLFFALSGEQSDGHRFVPTLSGKKGVAAVVRADYSETEGLSLPLIRVSDPLKAAQELAQRVRSDLSEARFVAVTGSAGKTTAKEFIYQILNHEQGAYRSPGNWNNWLGLPFALLNMSGRERYGIFEMGMSSPGIGEIEFLSGLLRPHVAIILNALPVHLEFLKSVERVARAKCEILHGLEPDGFAFYNVDSQEIASQLAHWTGKKLYSFSPSQPRGDLFFVSRRVYSQGTEMKVSFLGREVTLFAPITHPAQLVNALVAVGVGLALGLTPETVSERAAWLKPYDGRGVVKTIAGVTILDETYNANPEAVRMALEWLKSFSAPRTAVLGDMLELGEESERYHQLVGHYAAAAGLKRLFTVGERARAIALGAISAGMEEGSVQSFDTASSSRESIRQSLAPGDVVLFKASRGIALERALPF